MTAIDRNSNRPLQVQIQDYILSLIMKGEVKAGDSLLSEHDLAEKLGVSRLTVRKAYTELVKKGILFTVHGKGTFVVDSLTKENVGRAPKARAMNRMIGVLFPEITQYFGPIVKEIETCAAEDGYTISVMFNENVERERYAIEQMLSQNLSGIIITPIWQKGMRKVNANYERLMESELPFVMIGEPPFHVFCDSVYVDEAYAIYDIVQALLDLGHKEFVFLYDSVSNDPHAIMSRMEGFQLANRLLLGSKKPDQIDILKKDWKEKFQKLLSSKDPVTAVVASDDRTATSAYNAIHDFGKRIPDDVSVVGYDNTYLCDLLQVKLTSVAHNRRLIGRRAYEMLKARMNKEANGLADSCHIIVKPELIIRDSIGPLSPR